eukprot:888432-Prymnesium_polylepis.2
MVPCCDPITGVGAVIQDGDAVLDGSSAVVFQPERDANGLRMANISFYVRDSSGTPSAPATLTIDVAAIEDAPELVPAPEIVTDPLTPVFVPLRGSDAEGHTVTLTMASNPPHGLVYLPDGAAPGASFRRFRGGAQDGQIYRQTAVDVVAVSSFWAGSTPVSYTHLTLPTICSV